MAKFRTAVELPVFRNKMGYRHKSMMIGSCFAENIGLYLQEYCLPVMLNPFGILYNPFSIASCLEQLMTRKTFTEQDLIFSNGLYHSFSHHSRFSGTDSGMVLEKINSQTVEALNYLSDATHLFITFGTSWVFQHRQSGGVVSNCHKLPAATFNHNRLSVNQITEIWVPVIEQLKRINPKLQLVFTVSPIRHLKDGAHANQLSKSTLLIAIDSLISIYGNDRISYFPSYEIVLDELRDYRFYSTDMTHLSEPAIDFIREKFVETMLDYEAQSIMNEVGKLLQALKHKPFNPRDREYISFIETQITKIDQLQIKYPFMDFKSITKIFPEKTTL